MFLIINTWEDFFVKFNGFYGTREIGKIWENIKLSMPAPPMVPSRVKATACEVSSRATKPKNELPVEAEVEA